MHCSYSNNAIKSSMLHHGRPSPLPHCQACLYTVFTAQAEEAEEEARRMVEVYRDFALRVAAIPVIAGRKSRIESFAGANTTYTIEGMMGDCRALQASNQPAASLPWTRPHALASHVQSHTLPIACRKRQAAGEAGQAVSLHASDTCPWHR